MFGMSAFQLSYTTEQLFAAGMLALIRKEAPTQEYVHIIGGALGNKTSDAMAGTLVVV